MSKVTSSKIAPSKPESKNWRLMTFVGRAPASATQQVVNLTRSSFSSGTSPFKQQKSISAVSSESAARSTTASGLNLSKECRSDRRMVHLVV